MSAEVLRASELQVVPGAALALGVKGRTAALAHAAFLVPRTAAAHRLWSAEGGATPRVTDRETVGMPSHRSAMSKALRLGLALAALAAGCRAQAPVSRPLSREVVDWDEYTGRIQAVQSVEIRARVSGYLESVHFSDGQMVAQGDLLFVIDPR